MDAIVVGYDGSDAAERALARAADLAEVLSALLTVVSVSRSRRMPVAVPAPEPETVLVPSTIVGPTPAGAALSLPEPEPERAPEPRELAQRQLDQARMSLARRRVEVEYVAEVGDPAERLLAAVDARDADLIVVGT